MTGSCGSSGRRSRVHTGTYQTAIIILTCFERLPKAVLVLLCQGHARPRRSGLQVQRLLEHVRVVPPDVCLFLKRKDLPNETVKNEMRNKPVTEIEDGVFTTPLSQGLGGASATKRHQRERKVAPAAGAEQQRSHGQRTDETGNRKRHNGQPPRIMHREPTTPHLPPGTPLKVHRDSPRQFSGKTRTRPRRATMLRAPVACGVPSTTHPLLSTTTFAACNQIE